MADKIRKDSGMLSNDDFSNEYLGQQGSKQDKENKDCAEAKMLCDSLDSFKNGSLSMSKVVKILFKHLIRLVRFSHADQVRFTSSDHSQQVNSCFSPYSKNQNLASHYHTTKFTNHILPYTQQSNNQKYNNTHNTQQNINAIPYQPGLFFPDINPINEQNIKNNLNTMDQNIFEINRDSKKFYNDLISKICNNIEFNEKINILMDNMKNKDKLIRFINFNIDLSKKLSNKDLQIYVNKISTDLLKNIHNSNFTHNLNQNDLIKEQEKLKLVLIENINYHRNYQKEILEFINILFEDISQNSL